MEDLLRDLKKGVFEGMDELCETLRNRFRDDLRDLRNESANSSRCIEALLRRMDSPDDELEEFNDPGVAVGPHTGAFSGRSLHGVKVHFTRHNVHTNKMVPAVSTSAESQPNWGRDFLSQAKAAHPARATGDAFQFSGPTYNTTTGDRIWPSDEREEEIVQDRLNLMEPTIFDRIPSDHPLSTATQLPWWNEDRSFFGRNYNCPVFSQNPESIASTRPIPATGSVWSLNPRCSAPGAEHLTAQQVDEPGQPQVVPRLTMDTQSTSRASGGGFYRLKVDHYDGKEPLEEYLLQFDVIADALRWDRQQRTTMLAASLRGQALAVFSNMLPGHRSDWTRLVGALRLRFGREHLRELAHMELKVRKQQDKEDLPAFADDVQRLVRRAFPECPAAARDRIAIQQFVDGIRDLDVQDWVRMARQPTLDAAVVCAMECETSRRATRSNRSNVRAVEIEVLQESEDRSRVPKAADSADADPPE